VVTGGFSFVAYTLNIFSLVSGDRRWFGLVIGFINNFQVVATTIFTLLLISTSYNHSTLIFSVYFH
jgi:hypothetical protein